LRDRADEALQVFYPQMRKRPESMAEMLQNLDFHLGEPLEIVVVGPEGGDPEAHLDVIRETYLPHSVRLFVDLEEDDLEVWADDLPVVQGREPRDGEVTVYVCREGTCRAPVTSPEALEEQLQ
ncbi:MAG: hypothetical protein ABEN55_22685, partial [Bradymonadaceae bacterium]